MQFHEHTEEPSNDVQVPAANNEALLNLKNGIDGSGTPDPIAIMHAQKSFVEHLCRLIAKKWIESHCEKQDAAVSGECIGPSSPPPKLG